MEDLSSNLDDLSDDATQTELDECVTLDGTHKSHVDFVGNLSIE